MSNTSAEQPIENAVEIIERFGGIRPMSTKTGVAVTTIQGWKKRNVIPANRVDDVMQAAKQHGVDLSGLVEGVAPVVAAAAEVIEPPKVEEAPKVETPKEEAITIEEPVVEDAVVEPTIPEIKPPKEEPVEAAKEEAVEPVKEEPKKPADPLAIKHRKKSSNDNGDEDYTELVVETEKRGVAKGAMMATAVIVVIFIAVIAMLMPKIQNQGDRVAELEQELSQLQKQQTMFKGLVPQNWSEQLDQLKQELAATKDSVAPAVQEMKSISGELMAGDAVAIERRVEDLQSYVNEMTQSSSLSALYAHLENLRANAMGQRDLEMALTDLKGLVSGVNQADAQDQDYMNSLLDRARAQSTALEQTFADVPSQDLKAAAMLLTLTQMRSTLNRENTPFADDLALLMKMTSEEDTELRAALTRLAPHAEQGVLTPTGLSNEFRSLAGDVVVSSLKGEDVSLMEKAQARMNDFLAVEKDGELVSGTPTQAVVNKAQKQIDEGDISGAMSLLKGNLNSSELLPLSGWMEKAQGFLDVQSAETAIKQAIELNLGRGYLGGSQLLIKQDLTKP